mgnify:CR=1 FL=1
MKNKIQSMARALKLDNELESLSINDDIQLLSNSFDKDLDIICFVRLRNKADISYPNKQEIPTNNGIVLAYSQDYVKEFSEKNNLNLNLVSTPNKILGIAKLSKKAELLDDSLDSKSISKKSDSKKKNINK